jgi:hypothetical protein
LVVRTTLVTFPAPGNTGEIAPVVTIAAFAEPATATAAATPTIEEMKVLFCIGGSMLGFRPFGTHFSCRREIAEAVGARLLQRLALPEQTTPGLRSSAASFTCG